MAKRSSQLGRLRIKTETTFGTDMTSAGTSISGFLDVPYTRGTFNAGRTREDLAAMTAEQRKDAKTIFDIIGIKACAPTFEMCLHSHGVDIDGATEPPAYDGWALGLLLAHCLGFGEEATNNAAQTQVQAASTTTVINVTAGHGVNFLPGQAIACEVNGKLEAREVLSRSTDAISVKVAFSAIPDTGSVVRQALTYGLTNTADEGTLQLVYESQETSHRFGYFGCKGGFTLGLVNGQLAKITFNLRGVDWDQFGTASLAAATYGNYQPVAIKDSEFIVGEVGSTTRNLVTCPGREWAVALNYLPHETGAGVNGVAGWERAPGNPDIISGTINGYWDASEYDFAAAADNRTELAFFQQIGSAAGKCILISAPSVQVRIPQDADQGGLIGRQVSWVGRNDNSISSPSSDLDYSALRFHFF